jgi:hypothetical protein
MVMLFFAVSSVSGINGNVDLDTCNTNFPAIIKAKWLNGFEQASMSELETKLYVIWKNIRSFLLWRKN